MAHSSESHFQFLVVRQFKKYQDGQYEWFWKNIGNIYLFSSYDDAENKRTKLEEYWKNLQDEKRREGHYRTERYDEMRVIIKRIELGKAIDLTNENDDCDDDWEEEGHIKGV
jgi:hypothetical protein